jgi:hypothetical protein
MATSLLTTLSVFLRPWSSRPGEVEHQLVEQNQHWAVGRNASMGGLRRLGGDVVSRPECRDRRGAAEQVRQLASKAFDHHPTVLGKDRVASLGAVHGGHVHRLGAPLGGEQLDT